MYDRIPSPGKENRVSITQDNGQVITGVLAYADDATQEGSAYTKGNVLPDSVLSLIGLPTESSEPADMFNVLATAGDLHVWRRTKTVGDGIPEKPASYKLGVVRSGSFILSNPNGEEFQIEYYHSANISISKTGELSMPGGQRELLNGASASKPVAEGMRGHYFYTTNGGVVTSFKNFPPNMYFLPSNAAIRVEGGVLKTDKYQEVIVIPYEPAVPPGTYTDYPVSVNPNAYQTGSDAKPAGYKLGKVVNGTRKFAGWNTANSSIASTKYSSSVSVDPDGTVRLKNPTTWQVETSARGALAASTMFRGKFFIIENNGNGGTALNRGVVYFCPADANFGYVSRIPSYLTIDKYQPVTGYPAIPASTTIEYLGKLGNKIGAISGTYVGTGTYSDGNENSVSVPSEPIFAIIGSSNDAFIMYLPGSTTPFSAGFAPNDSYTCQFNYENGFLKWRSRKNAEGQLNTSGKTYKYSIFFR